MLGCWRQVCPYLEEEVLETVSHDALPLTPVSTAYSVGSGPAGLGAGLRHQLLGHHRGAHGHTSGGGLEHQNELCAASQPSAHSRVTQSPSPLG